MKSAVLLFLASCTALLAAPSQRPDILLVVADDLGWNDVGWHNPRMRTPHMDALVKAGTELDCHYVQPQCTPTRVALLTGRYPSRFGPHCTQAANERALPPGTPTLASLLKMNGYATGLFGKWHLGSLPKWGPNHYGFDHSYGSLAGACGVWDHRYRLNRPPYTTTWHRNHEFVDEEGHSTELVTDEAIRWMASVPGDRPFFCYVPFHAVHTPLAEKDHEWFEMNAHHADPDRRHFAAYVSHMDDCIGRLVTALENMERLDRTVIIFTSDNGGVTGAYRGGAYPPPDPKLKAGFSSNQPLRGGKSTSWEGGIRVPAFVHGPGFPNRKLPTPMHVIDWLPTLAGIAGFEPPAKLDGADLLAHLGQSPPERTFYTVWGGTGRRVALRRGDWKIRADRKSDTYPWELYNLRDDPNETTNLAAKHPAKVADLVRIFQAERAKDAQPATP